MIDYVFEHNGYTIEIHRDEDPESPREWDNLGTIVAFHQKYNLGDKHEYNSKDYNGWNELKKQIIKDHRPVIILPIYMMNHSGLSITTNPSFFQAIDPQHFDWGQIGFIFVSREKILKEYKRKIITAKIKKEFQKIEDSLISEIEIYNKYLKGDVFGYIVKKDDEEIDSCWGIFDYQQAIDEAKSNAS